MSDFGIGDIHICHSNGFSVFMATTSDTLYWAVFVKDEMRTRWPVNTRYTDKDEEVVAEQIMSTPVTETIIFGNLWYSRSSSGLVPVEEGVLKNWHSGRIVLIGDAVHKVSSALSVFS